MSGDGQERRPLLEEPDPASVRSPEEPAEGARSHLGLRRVVLLALGVWMGVCGGSLYAWPAFSAGLQARCNFDATQADLIYACGQIGVGLGLLPGTLYDFKGPIPVLLYGMVALAVSNWFLAQGVRHPEGEQDSCSYSAPHLAFLYLLMQNGSVALYQSGLFSNQRSATPGSQGFVTGCVAGGYGLSAAVWSGAFKRIFDGDLERYFTGTAVVFGSTCLAAVGLVPWLMKPLIGGPLLGRVSHNVKNCPLNADVAGRKSSIGIDSDTLSCRIKSAVLVKESWKLSDILRSLDFWLLAATFATLQAIGSGLIIANLALVCKSLSIPDGTKLFYVSTFAYFQCAARVACGIVMDFGERRGVHRGMHFIWTSVLMLVGMGVLKTRDASNIETVFLPCLLCIAAAYGSNWSIVPSTIHSHFGPARAGVCFNLCALLMSLSVTLTASSVGEAVDSMSTTDVQGLKSCIGLRCWSKPFSIGLGLAVTGSLTAAALAMVLRHRRRECCHHQDAPEAELAASDPQPPSSRPRRAGEQL